MPEINLSFLKDVEELENSFKKYKDKIPSSIEIDTRSNENVNVIKPNNIQEYQQKEFSFEKKIKNNIFLQMVLKKDDWKNDLIENFLKINCSVKIDYDSFKIIANQDPNKKYSNWKEEVDNVIKKFFRKFETKNLAYDNTKKDQILLIKNKIDQLRNEFKIEYMDDSNESRFFFMIEKIYFRKLIVNCPEINDLINCSNNTETNKKNSKQLRKDHNQNIFCNAIKEKIRIKATRLSQITYVSHKGLYLSLLERIKEKFSLEDYSIDKNYILSITGPEKNLDKSIQLVSQVSSKIKTKKIDGIDVRFFKCKTLSQIIDDLFLSLTNPLFSVEVKLIDGPNMPGFYISYLQSMPELDCAEDSVFEQAALFIKEKIYLEEINVTNYSHIFVSDYWKTFEKENFRPEIMSSNFWLSVYPGLNNQNFVYICGKKDYVQINKLKIENFLANNEKNILEISLDLINVYQLKFLNRNF